MIEYVFFLDLKDDQAIIEEYDLWHQKVWPEVESQILSAGILDCKIYRYHNRLVLIVQSEYPVDWERKTLNDSLHVPTLEWEELMWKFQQALPGSLPGQKWMMAEQIYKLRK